MPTDIDINQLQQDLDRLKRAIERYQAAEAQGLGSALHFEVLIRQVNKVAEEYS
jgi:hypothetical protein